MELIKETELKLESGQACRGRSHALNTCQLLQTGRDVPLHAPHRKASLLTIRQEEGNFSPPTAAQPIGDCSGPAHGKPPYSGPPAPPMGSGYHSPAQLPLLPIKARSPSSFSGFLCVGSSLLLTGFL